LRGILKKDKRLLTKAKRLARRVPSRSHKRLVAEIRQMIGEVRNDIATYC
jgi:hypothetical protein